MKSVKKDSSEPPKMMGVFEMFEKTWNLLGKNLKNIALIFSVYLVLSMVANVVMSVVPERLWFFSLAVFIFSAYIGIVFCVAVIISVKDGSGFEESYEKSVKKSKSAIWVLALVCLAIMGGYLFFLIPGFILSILLSMSLYALIFEDRKGMDALFRSVDLVQSNFWVVLSGFLVLLVAFLGVSFVLSMIFSTFFIFFASHQLISLVLLLFLFFFPLLFFLVFGVVMYQGLEVTRTKEDYEKREDKEKAYLYFFITVFVLLYLLSVIRDLFFS